MSFLSPIYDISFKKLFANEQHKGIVISFLNSVLNRKEGEKIISVVINDTSNLPEIEKLKYSIVDIRCTDQNDVNYIVEMQVVDRKDFKKRAQYYTSVAYARQLGEAAEYATLLPVIFVGIVNFNLFNNSHYISHHCILDTQTHEQTLTDLEFHFIELKKFNKTAAQLTDNVDKWIYLLKNAEQLKSVPQELQTFPEIKEAFTILEQSSWTLKELDRYQLYRDVAIAEKNSLETAKDKGKQEKAHEIARELLDVLDVETIAKKTGLTAEEVESLKNKK